MSTIIHIYIAGMGLIALCNSHNRKYTRQKVLKSQHASRSSADK